MVVLPDPAGAAFGKFDAAGDFDRLLSLETGPEFRPGLALPTLSRCDEYGAVVLGRSDLAAGACEAKALRVLARPGPEQRGLDRLYALATHGARASDAVLDAVGD